MSVVPLKIRRTRREGAKGIRGRWEVFEDRGGTFYSILLKLDVYDTSESYTEDL